MSDDRREPLEPEIVEDYDPTVPVSPQDVASAGRSCQAIVLILLVIVLLACLVVVVAVAS